MGPGRGRFVVFEGGDASGKSTQANLVAERWGALQTREPGGTRLGEELRRCVLEPSFPLAARTEALLIAAARAQHVAEVIQPALEAGRDVVCDRFTASSLAYQGHGSRLDVGEIGRLNEFATGGLGPDLTILLDVPVELSLGRLPGAPDRFEGEQVGFHQRVRDGYLALASADPDGWAIVDGTKPVAAVAAAVSAALARRWPEDQP